MNESKRRRIRDLSSGAPTLINSGCKVSGVISGQGDYQISGEIDGDCEIEGTVTLASDGYWQGTIRADNVVISGHVEGDIVATLSLRHISEPTRPPLLSRMPSSA